MFRKRGDISEMLGSGLLNEVNAPKAIELSYKRYLVKVCMLTGLPALGAFMIYDFMIGRYLIGVILFFLSSILISLFLLVNKPNYQEKENQIYRYFFTSFFILFGFYIVYSIGIEGKLSRIPWSYTFPVVVFFALGARSALVWAGMLFCALLFLGLYYPSNEQIAIHELKLRFYISFLWVILVSFLFERLRRKSQLDLAEKQQSLKQSETRYREAYEQLSIEVEERKRIETALRASEERFRNLAELLPEIVYEMDIQGKLTFVSHGAYDKFGLTQHDFDKGVNAFDMLAPEDRGRARENVKKILGGEKNTNNEYSALRKDGTTFPTMTVSNAILRNGKPVGLRGFIIDITERKKMEQALTQSEAKYRQIVESAPAAISEWDFAIMRFTKVNDFMCEYLGYTTEELTSMNPFDIISEENKGEATEIMNKLIAGEDMPLTYEFKMNPKDGRELWALAKTKIFNENGKPAKAVTVAHDISERKRLEGQLRHSQKMKAIGTLAGGIAHEFNNALGVLVGNIELMELDLPNNEIIKDYVRSINASTRRMAQLTDQLLAYARGGKYGSEIISLSDFVRETLPLVKRNVGPGIKLEPDLSKETSKVKADETQLKMVLSGLLKNASEAIEGEGRIRIKTRVEEIDEDFAQNHLHLNAGRYVSLTVEDDGRGMDEETKARIFDPFFTTKFQGRGLGMAAIHGIVENHGGWVQVESQLEKGTEVHIYLPLTETAKEEQQQATAEIPGGTHTILLVEDDASLVKVIQKNLEKLGYRVLAAKTAAAAVDISRTSDEDISLALLDLGLPDMRGEELYHLLMAARPELKVILASGYSGEDTAQQMLDVGAQAFVQKPFSLKSLAAKLDEVLCAQPPQ